MKQGHSGKVNFYLNVITGEVKHKFWNNISADKIPPQWVSVGKFYKFATLKSEYDSDSGIWTIYRGSVSVGTIEFEWTSFTTIIDPDYFQKIIAHRVTKKLRQ